MRRPVARRLAVMLPLGFASGLPLALSGGTLQLWLADLRVDITTIGAFTLVGLPYTLKFLWAPALDRLVPSRRLGRRRGWLAWTQLAIALLLVAMAFTSPVLSPATIGGLAVLLAFASASQDVAFDGYRAEVLAPVERGLGAALSVTGYRAAMVVSGGVAPIVADRFGWRPTYLLMAALIGIGAVGTVWAPRPNDVPARSWSEAFGEPIRDLLSRPGWALLLAAVVLYKLGDAFAGTLTNAFLVQELGFSVGDVGAVNKVAGLTASVTGALAGGALLSRWSLRRALVAFGILQALTNLGFAALSASGGGYSGMVLAVVVEQFCGGLGTAAFVSLLMTLCAPTVAAGQYAILSALAAIPRTLLGPAAGALVAESGWTVFFVATAVVALPGVWLVSLIRPGWSADEAVIDK